MPPRGVAAAAFLSLSFSGLQQVTAAAAADFLGANEEEEGRTAERAAGRGRAGVEGIGGGGGGGALQVIFHASRNSYGSENDREERGRERGREGDGESGAGSMTGLKLGPNGRTSEGRTRAAGLSSRPSSYSKSQNEAAAAAGDTNVRF